MCARGRAGFTLLELILVMLIIAIVFGVGAGMFRRIDLSDRVARPLVESVLRSAQNWAVSRGAAARVRIDPARGTLRAEGQQVIGTWHFESLPLRGAFGLDGELSGGELVDDGFQGKALSFVGQPAHSSVDIAVQGDPSYDLAEGFSLRCALRVEPEASGIVLTLGEVVGIEVGEQGALAAWFVDERVDEQQHAERGGRITLRADAHTLVPRRWAQVELRYDRRAFELFVDGARIAGTDETARVWKLEGSLKIAPGQTPFAGAIDSLVISAVGAADEAELPQNTHFAPDVPREILFQAGGGLDRTRHPEAVRIKLMREDGQESLVTVQPFGTVE